MEQDEIQNLIDQSTLTKDDVVSIIKAYNQGGGFTDRKLIDTPTDSNMAVPRGYVTMNGVSASRPTSSIIGQRYFDTSLGNGKPIYWNGTGFVDATGTFV